MNRNIIDTKDINIPNIENYFKSNEETVKKTEKVKKGEKVENTKLSKRKDDMICTYITRNKYSTLFSTLDDKKKHQVLDLGLNSLKLIDNKQLKWSEKEKDKKILDLNNEHNKEIDNLKKALRKTNDEILLKKKEINQQKDIYEKEIHNLKTKNLNDLDKQAQELKASSHLLYKNKLLDKDCKIQQLSDKLKDTIKENNDEINKIKQQNKKEYMEEKERLKELYLSLSQEKIQSRDEEIDNLRKTLAEFKEEKKEEIRNIITKYDDKMLEKDKLHYEEREKIRIQSQNDIMKAINEIKENNKIASVKGKIGETKVLNLLKEFKPNSNILDTSQKGGKGDFVMQLKDWKILIEVKNYNTSMKKKEVTKFIKDTKVNKDIVAGIMISLYTNIPNKTSKTNDIVIEYEDNKPLIYVGILTENKYKLKNVLDFLPEILKIKSNTINFEKITKIAKITENTLIGINNQEKLLKKYNENAEKEIEKMKKNLSDTLDILKQ